MRKRLSNSEIKARLALIVGIANDQKGWESISSILLVLAGALTGLLASNNLKDKADKDND